MGNKSIYIITHSQMQSLKIVYMSLKPSMYLKT